jgi:sugar lactone lactonase YvrE
VWADGQRILKTGLDGSGRTVLHTSERIIQDVVIDDSQVYWVARGFGEAELGRVELDGSDVSVLIQGAQGSDLASVTDLDVADGRAVWVSEGMFAEYTVVQANLDGSSKQTLTLSSYAYDGFRVPAAQKIQDVALVDGAIYITDQASHNIARYREGERMRTVLTPPIYGINALAVSAGTGTIYWADARLGINQAEADGASPTTVLPQASGFDVQGLAVDPERELIYWASPDGGITRATPDRSVFEDILRAGGDQNIAPIDIALDLTNERIYWMNRDARVMRARLDGSEVEELATGLSAPGPIAVDPANDALYWIDRGSFSDDPPPQMVRASLDGSNVAVLEAPVSRGTADLVVDAEAGLLYWDNMERGVVFQSNLDGTEAEPLIGVRRVVRALTLGP